MLFDGRPIRNVASLLRSVESELKRKRARTSPLWFRGCTDRDHSLVPSIGRPPYQLEHERPLINAFKQNAVQFLEHRPQTHWEWIFLARHHTVPTRLLDWTERSLLLKARCSCRPQGRSWTRHSRCLWPLRRVQSTVGVSVLRGTASGDRDERRLSERGISAPGHGIRARQRSVGTRVIGVGSSQ